MKLDQDFAAMVLAGITILREKSIVAKMMLCTRGVWTSTNADAISYCLDHQLFEDTVPDCARLVHRAIDCHGRTQTIQFLDSTIKIVD